jgi:flagellar motor protein MotB
MRAFREELSNTFGTHSRRKQRSKEVEVRHVHGIKLELSKPHSSEGDAHSEGTWIFSFADLIMNLLMFFVMMFAISSVDKGKFQEVQQAFSSMNDSKVESKSKVTKGSGTESSYAASTGVATSKSKLSNKEILDSVSELLKKVDQKSLSRVEKNKSVYEELIPLVENLAKVVSSELQNDPFSQGFEVIITEERLFAKNMQGDAVSKEGKELLVKLAKELNSMPRPLAIWIQGYSMKNSEQLPAVLTSKNSEKLSAKPLDSFSKSMKMANAVRSTLEEIGMSPYKHSFSLGGFGNYNAFHSASKPDGLSQKSRIVLRIAALPQEEKK